MYGRKANKVKHNTSQTVQWKEKRKNSRQQRMRTSLENTKEHLKNRSLYHVVVLPEKPKYYIENMEDPEELAEVHDWWAENTVDFLNEVQLIFGTLTDNNEDWDDICNSARGSAGQNSGYPKNVTYRWKANKESPPIVLPVDQYVDHVIVWCNAQIENEEIFPTDEDTPFPKDFHDKLQKMYKRLFRVFAIMFANPCLCKRASVESSLDLCFQHFLYFGWKWDLLDDRELSIISSVVKPYKKKFEKEKQLYIEKRLPIDTEG